MKVKSVVDVHDLHIWQITMGKTLLACHLRTDTDADSDEVGLHTPCFISFRSRECDHSMQTADE
jgi:Co/Zn/Cd efflux system component